METLIIHSPTLFDDQSNLVSYASSPPLPPAPLGDIPPTFPYGSTHTKFSEYGPQQQINAPLPQTSTPQTSTGDDFTPQLPPRPPASIHPSSRGNSGSTNGLSNTSPTRSEAETNLTSPASYIPSPPLPLRPGRQGALTPIQNLRGTKGLDFSQQEIAEGDRTGPAPAPPPPNDLPAPPPSAFKSSQTPPPPSALPQSTYVLQQQQQVALSQRKPALSKILTQEPPQPKAQPPPPLPAIERTAAEEFESTHNPLETSSSSTVDDGHSTDYASPITPDATAGPALQPVTSQTLTQREPQVLAQLQNQPQAPIKAVQVREQNQSSLAHSLRQSDEIPHGGPESRDLPPQLQ
jgi:hypothetical protein